MKATKNQIKQWLDMQIGVMAVQNQKLTLTEKIDYLSDEDGKIVPDLVLVNYSRTDHIHIGNEELRYVAEVMELPISATERKGDEDYKYELQFLYNDVPFIALESEEDYKKRGELA